MSESVDLEIRFTQASISPEELALIESVMPELLTRLIQEGLEDNK